MSDIEIEIRRRIVRLDSAMSLSQINSLIKNIADCYFEILSDNIATKAEWADFYNFSLLNNVALATIYRNACLEIHVFPADDSLIESTNRLALVDVAEFLTVLRKNFNLPADSISIAMSEAIPWMKSLSGSTESPT